jgi:hypothetical protein
MLTDGFYKVEFDSTLPGMGGIVIIENNTVRGGDAAFLYAGTLHMPGDERVTATITVSAYVPAPFPFLALSVFGAADKFTLTLAGNLITTDMFRVTGSADLPGSPAITIRGTKIAELDLR